jgi:hypothetical protein
MLVAPVLAAGARHGRGELAARREAARRGGYHIFFIILNFSYMINIHGCQELRIHASTTPSSF